MDRTVITSIVNLLLFRHVNRPEFQCRVHWNEGSVVIFDNRCVQHYAVPDYHERRIMHRITIRGERPVGPSARPCAAVR